MANGFGTSPFVLPNMFDKPGDALQQGIHRIDRERESKMEWDWRKQRQQESDDWRKLNLIQELSNVDKYQTGESVADAIGNMKSQEILQKYTALAGSMSPAELQAKISQDIQNTATGMQSMKDELGMATKTLADLKTRFPSLDTKALDRYYREDVLNRRMENGEFKNPIHVNPTNMRFDDPDFLAAFVSGDKAIRDEIVNPKLVEKGVQVGMGSPSSYTMVKGDIPFFRERNFDPEKDIKEGFLKKGIQPQMKLKSKIEKVNGQDVEVLNEDAYEVFSDNAKLEFNALAAKKFPDFYKLSKTERNKLTRKIALDEINQVDQSGFSFGTATKPPHYSSTTNVYGKDGGVNYRDIYKQIKDATEDPNRPHNAVPINELSSEAADAVVAAATKKQPNGGFDYTNIFVKKDDDGSLRIYKSPEGDLITTLTFEGTNVPVQPGVKEKRTVIQEAKNQPKPTPKIKKDPLGLGL